MIEIGEPAAAISSEVEQLAACEARIEAALKTAYYVTGAELRLINAERLYLAGYASFEAYGKQRWNWERAQLYRLIEAADVADRVSPMGDIPANERQARALAAVPVDAQADVWAAVLETTPANKVTAKLITETAAKRADHQLLKQDSRNVEYWTPGYVLERARMVLGAIELDPASCETANQTVHAERFFTLEDDGLAQDWVARTLWLNPPYGRDEATHQGNQGRWSAKLIDAYEAGHVGAAMLLVNASMSEHWFTPLKAAYPICFHDGRMRFEGPGAGNAPTNGNALIYFGRDVERFAEVFGVLIGQVMIPYRMVAALKLPDREVS